MQYAEGSGGKTIRVLVADDTRIHTQLLADALRHSQEFEVLSSPSHSQDIIELAKLQAVDVMVLSSTLDEQPYEDATHCANFGQKIQRSGQ